MRNDPKNDPNRIDPDNLDLIRAQLLETAKAPEDQLLGILSDDRSHVLAKVRACIRLAHVGSEESLGLLELLAANRSLAKSARFAHILISIRTGRVSPFLEAHRAAELRLEGEVRPIHSHVAPMENLSISPSLEELDIESSRPGACATNVRSGKTRLLILQTKDAVEHGFLKLGHIRPSLLGVLLQYGEEHRHWGVRSYFLGAPLSTGVWIALMRNDGDIEMAGFVDGGQVLLKSLECAGAMPAQILIHTAAAELFVTGYTALRRKCLGKVVPYAGKTTR